MVADGRALERSLELAGRLSELPAQAVATTKRVIDLMPDAPAETAPLLELLAYGMLAQTGDAHEAAQAFEEKRKPDLGASR